MHVKKIKEIFLRNIYLFLIITGIWMTLIGLFVFIKIYIVPLKPVAPLTGRLWDLITATVQVLVTGGFCLGGLYIWYRIIKLYFWRMMKKSGQIKEEKEDIIIKD